MASAALEWPKKSAARAYTLELSLACGSLDPYLPKNTSNCGTYSEPDPLSRRKVDEQVQEHLPIQALFR